MDEMRQTLGHLEPGAVRCVQGMSVTSTNGFLVILNAQRLADNLHFSWLEGKVRDKVLKRTASK